MDFIALGLDLCRIACSVYRLTPISSYSIFIALHKRLLLTLPLPLTTLTLLTHVYLKAFATFHSSWMKSSALHTALKV